MKTIDTDILNSKTLKAFIKGMIVLIGLFAVLYCGIDILVLILGKSLQDKLCTIIFALVSPIIAILTIFFGFFYFVKKLLFKSSGNKHKSSLVRMYDNVGDIIKVYQAVKESLESISTEDGEILQKLLIDIFERHSKKSIEKIPEKKSNP